MALFRTPKTDADDNKPACKKPGGQCNIVSQSSRPISVPGRRGKTEIKTSHTGYCSLCGGGPHSWVE